MGNFKINKSGIITFDGVVVPMDEKSPLYQKYVEYLTQGQTVEETEDTTVEEILLIEENKTKDVKKTTSIVLKETTAIKEELQVQINALSGLTESATTVVVGSELTNVAIGEKSLVNARRFGNVAVGKSSMATNRTGSFNTALGDQSMAGLTRGNKNVAIGHNAGKLISNNKTNNQSKNSIFIGSDSKPLSDKTENEIVIGGEAIGSGPNTTTIGNTKTEKTKLHGKVQGDGFVSSDGSEGINGSFQTIDGLTIIVKNGLIVSIKTNTI